MQIKAFTDNIVIGWPVRGDAESELRFNLLKYHVLSVENGDTRIFLRGAIALGDAYVDDVVVLGSAFLEAVSGKGSRRI